PLVLAGAFIAGVVFAIAFTWPTEEAPATPLDATPVPTRGNSVVFGETATPVPTPNPFTSIPPLYEGRAVTVDEGFAPIVWSWEPGPAHNQPSNRATVERIYVDPATGAVERETSWTTPEDAQFVAAIANDL